MNSYQKQRAEFYSRIEDFWADLYNEEYALYDLSLIEKEELRQVRTATNRIGSIFFKTNKLLREVSEETLLELGFPQETHAFLRLKTMISESVISRLDLIPSREGVKCIEINADTPTFIKELFHVNGLVCEQFGEENPNKNQDRLLGGEIIKTINELSKKYPIEELSIVFTAHEDNLEDRETVLYLQKLSGVPSRFIPLHKLQIEKGIGLFDEEGKRIHILYRQTFPIENLIADEDEDGNKIGLWLLELAEKGKIDLINPPSAFLMQNKAVQAVIWGLHQKNHAYFTKEEHQWIKDYFLPTFLEPDYFLEKSIAYVKKPAFGREGDTVEIYHPNGSLAYAEKEQSYTDYLPIYQQYIQHPEKIFASEKGPQTGKLLIGSFLINGKASAVGYRVGGTITNNLSYYLPVGVKKG
ncbi:glutathionylspermidine synthase family protein [Niallia nealsonii]|uniref:Glutathionylspermidine synthase n=1 Tax=Niallia nealsonii TaxID=115979 RepID=A0A2N0Z2L5_9BACI|nr:glutathionylspermidine synthase family protein [Niallia nealsonii]PKG23761.1 glutathionylspermidine synthase [Niallia nealsonii]